MASVVPADKTITNNDRWLLAVAGALVFGVLASPLVVRAVGGRLAPDSLVAALVLHAVVFTVCVRMLLTMK